MRRWWITGAVLAVALLTVACGGEDPAADEAPTTEAGDDAGETGTPEPEGEAETGTDAPAESADDQPDAGTAADDPAASAPGTEGDDGAAAQPAPAALEEPCADHAGREDEMFIELVSPVDEQSVDGEIDLVGCSNVNEGTVTYRLLDGDGRTLDEGFTTAECGTGCVGEFRDVIDLAPAEGEPAVYVQVFSESMADGSEEALTEVIVVPQ